MTLPLITDNTIFFIITLKKKSKISSIDIFAVYKKMENMVGNLD